MHFVKSNEDVKYEIYFDLRTNRVIILDLLDRIKPQQTEINHFYFRNLRV